MSLAQLKPAAPGQYSSLLFKAAVLASVLANYGRYNLEKEIVDSVDTDGTPLHHLDSSHWLGYRPNAWTAIYGFRQGYFYYSAMTIFYYHLATLKRKLTPLEWLGVVNQVLFHVHSIREFKGLSKKVSALFATLIALGALALQSGY